MTGRRLLNMVPPLPCRRVQLAPSCGTPSLPQRESAGAGAAMPPRGAQAPVGRRRRTRTIGRIAAGSLTWLGHSTVLIDVDGVRLLTDPALRRRIFHLRGRPASDPSALARIDAVLVSHVHYDHLDLPSLDLLARTTTVVVPRGAARLVRRRGFERVVEVVVGDTVDLGPAQVRVAHAEHDDSRRPFGVRAQPVGYVVDASERIYFAGDTDLFPAMRELGPLDVALLPVAGWGNTLPAGHLDPESAAQALLLLRPRVAI